MATRIASLVVGVLLLTVTSSIAATYSAGTKLGYVGAPGAQAYFQVSEFARDLPLDIRLGLEFAAPEPGSPTDARRIFINDATNGVPEESGQLWSYRLDLSYPFSFGPIPRLHAYGGPRYASFKSNFKFIGGNEDFDVTSGQWGWGLGLEGLFAISSQLDFLLGAGFDHFFESELRGHDTIYAPDGETVNGRRDYTYEDADEIIDQPKLNARVMLGLSYRFGF